MKKSYVIYIIAVVILLILIIASLGVFSQNKRIEYTNKSLEINYPLLKNYAYAKYLVNDYGIFFNDSVNSLSIDGKSLSYDKKSLKFSCNGQIREGQLYYKLYVPHSIGGWDSIYVIDCDTHYWVFDSGDAGPHLAGPFNK